MEKDFASFFAESKKVLEEYVQTRLSLFRVRVAIKVSRALSVFFTLVMSALLFFLVIIFLGMTAGFWLGALTGSTAAGFLIVTLIYLLLLILAIVFRKQLFKRPITNMIVSVIEEELEEDLPG
jgi:Putative Actinobacterial Holin-X, holin superfamily III